MGLSETKILVVGAGIGGLTAAIALRQAGFQVHVLERVPEIRPVGAGIMLQMNAMAALDCIGLSQQIIEAGRVLTGGEIRNRNQTVWLRLEFERLSRELGHPCVAIHRGRLQSVLLEALGREYVSTGANVDRIVLEGQSVRVPLPDGGFVDGDALVGCDGIQSVVRRHLWGEQPPRFAGYTAWRGVCQDPQVTQPDQIVETWGRRQLFGHVPLGERLLYWFATKVTEPGQADTDDPRDEILRRFEGWPGSVAEILKATSREQIIRSDIYDRPPRFPWGTGRVTLLGDAAHPMRPNLGQGGGQAIEDGVVLAHCLKQASSLETGLRAYEARRHKRTKGIVAHSRLFMSLAHGHPLWARIVRATAFRWMPEKVRNSQMRKLYSFKLAAD